MYKLALLVDQSEIVPYDDPGIPVLLEESTPFSYPNHQVDLHWHDDPEWIYVHKGDLKCYINGQLIHLKQGYGVLINSGIMHSILPGSSSTTPAKCIVFKPDYLFSNKKLYEKYVHPVVHNAKHYMVFYPNEENTHSIVRIQDRLYRMKNAEKRSDTYDIDVMEGLLDIWKIFYQEFSMGITSISHQNRETDNLRRMITYLKENYGEKISLEQIASVGYVSRSECCRLFKKYVKESPINYLIQLRLTNAAIMLKTTDMKVTDISVSCGFNNLSYFSRKFEEQYGRLPAQYRKS